jgi:hypothetical protein
MHLAQEAALQLLTPFGHGEKPQLAPWYTHTATPITSVEVLLSPKMPKKLVRQSRT